MAMISLSRILAHWAHKHPDAPAVTHDNTTLSWAELDRASNRLARAYAALGVKKNDFVTIALPNGIEFLVAAFATWKLGAIPQPVSAKLPRFEREQIIALANPTLVVGLPAGEAASVASLPIGFVPDAGLSDADLPEVSGEFMVATTSGGIKTDPYKATPDELYVRGKAQYDAGRLAEAAPSLEELFNAYTLRDDITKDSARMLLLIHIKDYNPRKVVQYFEVVKEKAPELVVSFDDLLVIGRAYRDINEYERAYIVWRGVAEASYLEDARVGEVLRQRGKTLEGITYLLDLWREYPNTASIEGDFWYGHHYEMFRMAATFREMVKTGKEPIPHEEILEVTAIVRAAAKSLTEKSRLVELSEVM